MSIALSGHLLQIGELTVLELKQTLEGLNLILQVFNAAVQLSIFTAGTFQLFHGNRFAGIHAAGQITVTPGRAALGGIAGITFLGHQKLQFSLATSRCSLFGWLRLLGRRCGIHGTLWRLELLILLADDAGGFSPGTALDLVPGGYSQHFTALETVDVATDKGIRIEVLDGQHDLLHGYAVIRANTGSDRPESIGGTGRAKGIRGITTAERTFRLGLAADRFAAAGCRSGRLGGTRSRARCSHLFTDAGILGIHGRINQHRIFTHQAAVRPAQLQQEVQVRFAQGFPGGDVDHEITVSTGHNLKTELTEKLVTIQPYTLIGGIRSNIDQNIARAHSPALGQNNLRIQWLIQIGLKFDFSQPQGLCNAGTEPSCQSQGNRKLAYLHAFSFPVSVIRYCFLQNRIG